MNQSPLRAFLRPHVPACLVGMAYVVAYVAIAFTRMTYPYEVNWFEGSSVDLVRRILAGQSIYVAPSIEFIPHIYAPLSPNGVGRR